MRIVSVIAPRCGWMLGLCVVCAGLAWSADDERAADRAQIEQAAVAFVEAYNGRQLDKLADLFAPDAEVLQLGEEPVVGRDAIRQAFQAAFAARPKAQLSLSIEALRFITGDVAFEDGTTTNFADGETPATRSRYSVVHVRRDGAWRMKLVRELQEEPLTPYARLQDLEWLLGDWIDEAADSVVATSCRWDENKCFLLRDFEVRTRGEVVLKGQQRIGWDPLGKQIRSWAFDNTGGFGEGIWTQLEDRWVIKSTGVRADGRTASMTQIVAPLSEGRMAWRTEARLVGDEELPPLSVIMVRRAPKPAAVSE